MPSSEMILSLLRQGGTLTPQSLTGERKTGERGDPETGGKTGAGNSSFERVKKAVKSAFFTLCSFNK